MEKKEVSNNFYNTAGKKGEVDDCDNCLYDNTKVVENQKDHDDCGNCMYPSTKGKQDK